MNLIDQTATLDQLNLAASQRVKEKKYWKKKYGEVQTPGHFPCDNMPKLEAEIRSLDFKLDTNLSDQLRSLSNKNQKTLHVVLMTGVIAALY